MAPNVSICIPTYNRKHFLKETLDSVFAQTYKDFEVVIVDDGSTDGTKEMLQKCGYNVRYYWQKNQGESAARNKLVELSNGKYLTFIDSDDLLFPYAVEELVEAIEKYGPDTVAYSSYVGIDEKGTEVKRKQRKLPSGNIVADLFEYIYVHSCGTMCTKELFQEVGGFDVLLPVCSPYIVWLKLSLGHRFIAVEKPTFKRRRHSSNLSERSFANCKIELEVLENFYYNDGGKNVIPYKLAMKRLSKEQYRAARIAIRESMPETACDFLKGSLKRHFRLKTLFWLIIAKLKSWKF